MKILGCPGWSPSSVSTPFTLESGWSEKKLSYFSKKSNVQNIFKMCFRTQITQKTTLENVLFFFYNGKFQQNFRAFRQTVKNATIKVFRIKL